jgi:hypothetical protein
MGPGCRLKSRLSIRVGFRSCLGVGVSMRGEGEGESESRMKRVGM